MKVSLISLISFFLFQPLIANSSVVYTHPTGIFQISYDSETWKVASKEVAAGTSIRDSDQDNKMAERTLVSFQRNQSNEKYHSRFSVVQDSLNGDSKAFSEIMTSYQKKALDFLKGQQFVVDASEVISLPQFSNNVLSITAHHRHFGLTLKQLIIFHKTDAYLLTASTRTELYKEQERELKPFFESFRFVR